MLQQEEPEDFVIATGKQYSVRDFVVAAGALLDMKIEWRGEGVDEVGVDTVTGRNLGPRRPALFPAHRGRDPAGGCHQGRREARLDRGDRVRRTGRRDGRRRIWRRRKRDAMVAKEGYQVYSHHE